MPWNQFLTIVGQVVIALSLGGGALSVVAEMVRSKRPTIEQREREARLERYRNETSRSPEDRSNLTLGEQPVERATRTVRESL